MKNKHCRIMVVTIILILSFALTGCENIFGGSNGDTVKIGYIASLTSAGAYTDVPPKMAMEDYIEEINNNGGLLGKKVELVTYDNSKDPPTESVTIANRMIQKDKVIAILGPTSSRSTMPIIPLCNESQTPGIGISATNPSVTIDDATGNVHPYMFRVCFIDPYQGTALASFAYNDLEIKKVASLMRVNDPYAQGLVQFFKENFVDLGGELLEMGYQDKEVEFRAQLSQASDAGVEALFIPVTEYKDAAMIAKQADELGLKFTYLFPDGAYASELLDVAGKELEGAYISTGVSEDDPAFAEYKEAFNKKHESSGYTANIFAYYALDAIKLLEYAVNEAQSFEGEAIKDALENAKDVPLFTEPITIDPETHNPLNKTLNIVKVVDNKYELFRTYRPEE